MDQEHAALAHTERSELFDDGLCADLRHALLLTSARGTCYGRDVERDPFSGEQFARVVGRRTRAPIGEPPGPETRAALAQMARYVTRAPKGVFIYRSHEEANADRDRWTIEAIVAKERDG